MSEMLLRSKKSMVLNPRPFSSGILCVIRDSPYYYPDGSLKVTLEARLAIRKLWEKFQPFT